jgi:hypothetical protein
MDELGEPPNNTIGVDVDEQDHFSKLEDLKRHIMLYTVRSRYKKVNEMIDNSPEGKPFFPTQGYKDFGTNVLLHPDLPYGKGGMQVGAIAPEERDDTVCSYESVMSLNRYWMLKVASKSDSRKYKTTHSISGEYN